MYMYIYIYTHVDSVLEVEGVHDEVAGLDAEEHPRGDVGLRLEVEAALVVVGAREPEHRGDERVAVEVHRVRPALPGDVAPREHARDSDSTYSKVCVVYACIYVYFLCYVICYYYLCDSTNNNNGNANTNIIITV